MGIDRIQILVIDGFSEELASLEACLQTAFPKAWVLKASSGADGLALAAAEIPDVVLLDARLPDIDGFEVCRQLKSDPVLAHIPVVFATAMDDDRAMRILALDSGAEAFLSMPLEEIELSVLVRVMLKISKANINKISERERLAALVDEQTRALNDRHRTTINLMEDIQGKNLARQAAEQRKEVERAEIEALINSTDDLIWSVDKNLNLLTANESFLDSTRDFLGKRRTPGEPILQNDMDSSWCGFWETMYRTVLEGNIVKREVHIPAIRDLPDSWLDLNLNPIHDGTKIVGVACFGKRITQKKRAEELLYQSEERLRLALENAAFPIMIHAEDGSVEMINAKWTELTGYTLEDIPTTSDWALRAYGHRHQAIEKEIHELYSLEGRKDEGEYCVKTFTGETLVWDFGSAGLGKLSDGRRAVISMAKDVTTASGTKLPWWRPPPAPTRWPSAPTSPISPSETSWPT